MEPEPSQTRSHPFILTALMWMVALVTVVVAGLVATEFILMATSLDPSDMFAAGVEPWRDAALAAGAFLGLLVATTCSLWLWHTVRFWSAGVVLMALEVVGVAWVCMRVVNEYF